MGGEDGKGGGKRGGGGGGAGRDTADERDGDQEAEEREAGDGLINAGEAECEIAQRGTMNDEHAERHADGDGEGHGDEDKAQVSGGGFQDFGAMLEEKGEGAHADAPGSGTSEEVKACTSGCWMRRNSCGGAAA